MHGTHDVTLLLRTDDMPQKLTRSHMQKFTCVYTLEHQHANNRTGSSSCNSQARAKQQDSRVRIHVRGRVSVACSIPVECRARWLIGPLKYVPLELQKQHEKLGIDA